MVHRDIKPENVLLSGGAAVVTDFGVSKGLSASVTQGDAGAAGGALTQVGFAPGTPAYMAPDQALGEGVDHRAYLYVWGVLAYELRAGAHPFAGRASGQAFLVAHLSEAPTPLQESRPDVAPALPELVMRCLSKRPDERPASAREVLDTLDARASTHVRPDVELGPAHSCPNTSAPRPPRTP